MKKTLLLLVAAIGLTTTAKAQVKVTHEKERADMATVAPVSVETSVDAEQSVAPNINGPKRSIANKVWYKRPAGTFFQTASTYKYMIVPPFTELTWTNMYTDDPSAAVWTYGATAQNAYEAGKNNVKNVVGNLVNSYNMHTGTSASYGPFICVEGVDTFSIIQSQLEGYPLVIAPDTIRYLMHIPATVQYSGFTNFKYGTNAPISATRDGATDTYLPSRFYEFYRAPAQPLYLDGITLFARMPEGKTVPVEAGSEGVTCYVIQAGDNGVLGNISTFTDTLAVIPINPVLAEIDDYEEGYLTTIKGYCMNEDEFGDMTRQPVVVEKAFVLVFEGFNNDGVDFMVNMSAIPEEELYGNGGPCATLYDTYWTSDGAERGQYWQYNYNNKAQYNMHIRLNAMWDVVTVDDDCLEMTAPTAGGALTFTSGGSTYGGVYIQSVFPYQSDMSPMPSYEIENLPDWLSITGYNDTYYTSNYGWITVLTMQAEALPAGVEGRQAKLHFISEMGAKSNEFTVTQGDAEAAGINGITVDEEVKGIKRGTFNLAGQRVGKDYKGIVIENGQKVIRK